MEFIAAIKDIIIELRKIHNEDTSPDKASLWALICDAVRVYLEYIKNLNLEKKAALESEG